MRKYRLFMVMILQTDITENWENDMQAKTVFAFSRKNSFISFIFFYAMKHEVMGCTTERISLIDETGFLTAKH